jgi:hypothetical protein
MNPYCCRECGMTFSLEETHEAHKNQHFKEKMMKTEGGSTECAVDLCRYDVWQSSGEIMLSNDKFRVNESRWP